jgi:hypothetical protein
VIRPYVARCQMPGGAGEHPFRTAKAALAWLKECYYMDSPHLPHEVFEWSVTRRGKPYKAGKGQPELDWGR